MWCPKWLRTLASTVNANKTTLTLIAVLVWHYGLVAVGFAEAAATWSWQQLWERARNRPLFALGAAAGALGAAFVIWIVSELRVWWQHKRLLSAKTKPIEVHSVYWDLFGVRSALLRWLYVESCQEVLAPRAVRLTRTKGYLADHEPPIQEKATGRIRRECDIPSFVFRFVDANDEHIGFGSLIIKDGKVRGVTALHVAIEAVQLSPGKASARISRNGRSVVLPLAKVARQSTRHDQIWFEVPNHLCSVLGLKAAASGTFAPGVGYVTVYSPRADGGIDFCLAPARTASTDMAFMYHECSTQGGSSGSPVVQNGRVVGVHISAGKHWNMASLLLERKWFSPVLQAGEIYQEALVAKGAKETPAAMNRFRGYRWKDDSSDSGAEGGFESTDDFEFNYQSFYMDYEEGAGVRYKLKDGTQGVAKKWKPEPGKSWADLVEDELGELGGEIRESGKAEAQPASQREVAQLKETQLALLAAMEKLAADVKTLTAASKPASEQCSGTASALQSPSKLKTAQALSPGEPHSSPALTPRKKGPKGGPKAT